MSINVSVLKSALEKVSVRLVSDKLSDECYKKLAREILDPSEGYHEFRDWYEDILSGFKDVISFNETVNLIKYCGLCYPASAHSQREVYEYLKKRLSFDIPSDGQRWGDGIALAEKNRSAADMYAFTQAPIDTQESTTVKNKWGKVKKFVKKGYFTQLKVVKLKPASIIPDGELSGLRRTHVHSVELPHVETRGAKDKPTRPLIRQRSKSFDYGSTAYVTKAVSLSAPGSPINSDDDSDDGHGGLFDVDEGDGKAKPSSPVKSWATAKPRQDNSPSTSQKVSGGRHTVSDFQQGRSLAEEEVHRGGDCHEQAVQRRRTAGYSLRGHQAVNLPSSVSSSGGVVEQPVYACPPRSSGQLLTMKGERRASLGVNSVFRAYSIVNRDSSFSSDQAEQPAGIHPSANPRPAL